MIEFKPKSQQICEMTTTRNFFGKHLIVARRWQRLQRVCNREQKDPSRQHNQGTCSVAFCTNKALSFSCSDVCADYRSPQSTESLFCDLQILYTQNCILPLQQKLLYMI
jgi:hypothetical protein